MICFKVARIRHVKTPFETLPGLTGLWQVNGKNRTIFEQMIEWDISYVENQSFWLDLSTLVRTVPALLLQVLEIRRGRKELSADSGSDPVCPQPANK